MVSGERFGVSLCGLVKKGHPRGEGGEISWICRSEELDCHLQHDMRMWSWYDCPYPWKRSPSNAWNKGRAGIWRDVRRRASRRDLG